MNQHDLGLKKFRVITFRALLEVERERKILNIFNTLLASSLLYEVDWGVQINYSAGYFGKLKLPCQGHAISFVKLYVADACEMFCSLPCPPFSKYMLSV